MKFNAPKQQVKIFPTYIEGLAEVGECKVDICGMRHTQSRCGQLVTHDRDRTVRIGMARGPMESDAGKDQDERIHADRYERERVTGS
ncbi:hypothetical protein ASE77_15855 [Sphingomonas sp. Leaf226]|nr:hypothetical protein ASE77_15855 [Sphingomonas sp. Leaf226]